MYPVRGLPAAVAFALPDVAGACRRLADYRGRYVLINFWAVWCAPCRKEMPSLDKAFGKLRGERFTVLGIHVGPSRQAVVRYLDEISVTFTVLIDEEMEASEWGVRGLPTTILVDPAGRMAYRAVGEKDWASPQMLAFFESLIERYGAGIRPAGDEPSAEVRFGVPAAAVRSCPETLRRGSSDG